MRGQRHVVQGPMAAGIAGRIYRQLNDENYFSRNHTETGVPPIASLASQYPSPSAFKTPILDDERNNKN
jgi:hypothetical protein